MNKIGLEFAKQNLETYCLIWLDRTVNRSKENIDAQNALRKSVNHLVTFENEDLCLKYIDDLPDDECVILIVSGRLGQILVPQVAPLKKIQSIYVYCMNREINALWAQSFVKIKAICVQLNELIQKIESDHGQRQRHRCDELIKMNILNGNINNTEQSSMELNGQFMYFHLLLDCLVRMESMPNDQQEFISICKEQYKNNLSELKVIEEFNNYYTKERAIWWYTRDCFLYRLLNKALRVQNIDLLYLLKFFIRDISQQLNRNRYSSAIQVYRGQHMSKDEIKVLKNSIGQFISINSFFSTTLNKAEARFFLNSTNCVDDMEPVFFEINANPCSNKTLLFSKIDTFSYYPTEEEVLFMIGSIFRIDHVKCESGNICNIQMTSYSNNDHQLQTLFDYMKNEKGEGQTNLQMFGHVLRKMGKFDHAEKYYRRCLSQLTHDNSNVAHCYHALGLVAADRSDIDSSLEWFKKSLELFQSTFNSDDSNIAIVYNSIAIIYQQKRDYNRSLEFYRKALMIWKTIHGENHICIAICLNNMSNVYRNEKKYSKALEYAEAALSILQNHLPDTHSDLASSYGSIGNIHLCLGHCDQALEYYNRSLTIYQKSLPLHHPDIAMTLKNIATVYDVKEEYEQALNYFMQCADIYRYSLPSTHTNIIQIEENIQRISMKLK